MKFSRENSIRFSGSSRRVCFGKSSESSIQMGSTIFSNSPTRSTAACVSTFIHKYACVSAGSTVMRLSHPKRTSIINPAPIFATPNMSSSSFVNRSSSTYHRLNCCINNNSWKMKVILSEVQHSSTSSSHLPVVPPSEFCSSRSLPLKSLHT